MTNRKSVPLFLLLFSLAAAPASAIELPVDYWVDAKVLKTDAPAGSIVEVEVTAVVDDYDFTATYRRTLVEAPRADAATSTRGRALPMLASIGSFGR